MFATEWENISIQNRKEKIYSIDLAPLISNVYEADDSLLAVGSTYTGGAVFFSSNKGRTWRTYELSNIFPFKGKFSLRKDDNLVIIAGYNFAYDCAQVSFLDINGNELKNFLFDGELLPYCKSFFDFEEDSYENLYFCGYGGSVFIYSVKENSWKKVLIDSNLVFSEIKVSFIVKDGEEKALFYILGGKKYNLQTKVFFSNDNLRTWQLLKDFKDFGQGVNLVDFSINVFDTLTPQLSYYVGTNDDTLCIWKFDPLTYSFETHYLEQITNQPLAIAVGEDKAVCVVDNKGRILFYNDSTKKYSVYSPKSTYQFSDAEIFSFLTLIIFSNGGQELNYKKFNFEIYAFGVDGAIFRNFKDYLLYVEPRDFNVESIPRKIVIFNILGEKVKTFEYSFPNSRLNEEEILENLPKGVYCLLILNNDMKIFIKKLVKF
ncbi:MAG: T9SS type A sorting domain-containing protein [Ignavibacteria bacterium]|nr:T9SS type A sorting domain-containing protein [Ignavibacteria bacterium]